MWHGDRFDDVLLNRPIPKQTVAPARRRLQQAAVRTERFAHRGDMSAERIFLHDPATPDAVHEVVLGDEFAGGQNQALDDFEGARPDRDRNTAHPKLTPREIDLAFA